MGTLFQTQVDTYASKAIVIPINGAAATLLSLIGALDILDSNGVNLGDISKNLHRVTGVRITGMAAVYLYGRTSAAAIPGSATLDLLEPVAGQAMLGSFFQSTTAGTVVAHVVLYID